MSPKIFSPRSFGASGFLLLKITYTYDRSKWLLTKETAVNGQEYSYSYDRKSDEMTKLSSTVGNQTLTNEFGYTLGYPTRISHNGFDYTFGFDGLGRQTSICVADSELANVQYLRPTETTESVRTTYGTGESMQVDYDSLGNPVKKTYTNANGASRVLLTSEIGRAHV